MAKISREIRTSTRVNPCLFVRALSLATRSLAA